MINRDDPFETKSFEQEAVPSSLLSTEQLSELLQPETELEHHLLSLPEVQHGLRWGRPRAGHPEGQVAFHVREIFDNIECIEGLSEEMRRQLRLVALIHDTFKYAEGRERPRNWEQHHAVLARKFLEQFTDDAAVLDVVEVHDDGYYAWVAHKSEAFRSQNPHKTLEHLHKRIAHCLPLFYAFFKCDTYTGDKLQSPILWFEENTPGLDFLSIPRERLLNKALISPPISVK